MMGAAVGFATTSVPFVVAVSSAPPAAPPPSERLLDRSIPSPGPRGIRNACLIGAYPDPLFGTTLPSLWLLAFSAILELQVEL
jgi:hypothetical protein